MPSRRLTRTLSALLPLLALPIPNGRSQAPSQEVIAGHVTDVRSGQPLRRALVSLEDVKSNHIAASVYTATDGSFHFEATVPAGKYRLLGRAAGHLETAYLQHDELSTAIVTGAGLPTGDLNLSLMPAGAITGRVLDASGEPVANAFVRLYRQEPHADPPGIRSYQTTAVAEEGEFSFDNLPPGRYFVAATGTPWYAVHPPSPNPAGQEPYAAVVDSALDIAYPMTFYPAATSSDTASPLDLAAGDQAVANLQMVPEPAVSITLRRPAGEDSPGAPPMVIQTVFGVEESVPVPVQSQGGSGVQVLQGLAPGHYTLRQFVRGGSRLALPSGTLDLTSGSVTRELTDPPSAATLTIKTAVLGNSALPAHTQLTLRPDKAFGGVSSEITEKGEAEFKDLAPGDYKVSASSTQRTLTVVSVQRSEDQNGEGRLIHIQGSEHASARVTLSQAELNVEGIVKAGEKSAPGVLVLLVPAEKSSDPDLFRRDQTDLDGSFTLPNVVPGKYLIVALGNAWSISWSDIHALAPYLLHAQPLVVSAGGPSTLHLEGALSPQMVP